MNGTKRTNGTSRVGSHLKALFSSRHLERIMQVFNVVKFKVKLGQEDAFLNAHRNGKAKWPGLERGVIIKTGDETFCLIGTWSSQEALAAARPAMIETLASFRSLLEDQGGGRGITDAVSGPVVLDL